jgi:8-oxo-dGTP pyrophosphatase MutT (NUDIX family)
VDFRERIRSVALGDGAWLPPEPRDAASMVLIHDGRVLMMRRAATMRFAPGMYVFPGGRVEDGDHLHADPFLACAVREVAEEVGVESPPEARFIDHWITPEFETVRFDVRFYAVEVSDGLAHRATLTTSEGDALVWQAPMDALALPILRPTRGVLTKVDVYLRTGQWSAPVPSLPRPRIVVPADDIRWDVVHAYTGEVLEADVVGPTLAEASATSVVDP